MIFENLYIIFFGVRTLNEVYAVWKFIVVSPQLCFQIVTKTKYLFFRHNLVPCCHL